MRINSSDVVISWLVEAVSKNGSLLLNVSPMADGTIPQDQQNTLLGVGKWLETNGEAIYDTHSWIKFEESGKPHTYFTVKGDVLYAILSGKAHGSHLIITFLAQGQAPSGAITSVTMLGGGKKPLSFRQDSMGLKVQLPASARADGIYTLKITGLKMNPPTWTVSGDPMQGNGVAAK